MGKKRSNDLFSFDAIRGIAALEVCCSHLRAFSFVNFPRVGYPTRSDQLFYLLTGMGHQAVVVFFVMSGWLVGGSIWQQLSLRQFTWPNYARARLTRLWIVLIPALIWTIALDSAGRRLSGGYGYDGSEIDLLLSGPGKSSPIDLSMRTFIGNLFFLQTIRVPVLGTNGPLWSLANEFWYYLMFPLLCIGWCRRGSYKAVFFVFAALVVLFCLPSAMAVAFLIWLMGWAGYIVHHHVSPRMARAVTCLSLLAVTAVLVESKKSGGIELLIGATVACLLAGVGAYPPSSVPESLRWLASHLAKISYTLYLFHFPILAFFFFSLHVGQRQPSPQLYAEFAGLLLAVLSIAAGMWYLFERKTDAARKWLSGSVMKPSVTATNS